jgi:Pyridoxamine 5'-phosphate oxidase
MPRATPTAELLFGKEAATPISTDEATVKPWSQAQACLQSAPKIWLSTVRPDGRPHVMPVLLVWVDDAPRFTTRPTSRKGRNLARNPHCVISVAGEDLDLVVEGSAIRTEDEAELLRVASAYRSKYDWELAVRDGLVHDDSLPGSPEYAFYEVAPIRAFGYGPDGLTATRWRFG